jgi:hypothetical protein
MGTHGDDTGEEPSDCRAGYVCFMTPEVRPTGSLEDEI